MRKIQIVTTPSFDWLAERATACTSRMLVSSPYVNDGIIKLTDMVSSGVRRSLVTRTDLRDFAAGASSLSTLCALAESGVSVYSLSSLHAKMYIFDDTSALVTSANSTNSGMWRNLECGLCTDDKPLVRNLAKLLLSGLGAEAPPSKMTSRDLDKLYGLLAAIKATLPVPSKTRPTGDEPLDKITYSITDTSQMLKEYSGWRKLTLQGVLSMPENGFLLNDLYEVCGPIAARRYPKNQHVHDKLRQQLQLLRDIGIVEFDEHRPGHYKRTMSLA